MKGRRHLRNESGGFPLTATHMCTPPNIQTYGGCWRIQGLCLDGRNKISKGGLSCHLRHRCVGRSLPDLCLAVSTTPKTSFSPWSRDLLLVPPVCGTTSNHHPRQRPREGWLAFHKTSARWKMHSLHGTLRASSPRLVTAVSLALWTRTSGHWKNKAQTFFRPDSYYIIFSEDAAKKKKFYYVFSLCFPSKPRIQKRGEKFKKTNSAYTARHL